MKKKKTHANICTVHFLKIILHALNKSSFNLSKIY
jgi:hypothetical protein